MTTEEEVIAREESIEAPGKLIANKAVKDGVIPKSRRCHCMMKDVVPMIPHIPGHLH